MATKRDTAPSVNHAELYNIVKNLIVAKNKDASIIMPLMVWGKHAVGKTTGIEQIAKDLNMQFVPVHVGQNEVTDLIGIPYTKNGITEWALPDFFANAMKDERPAIFFLDEFNRSMDPQVYQAMFPFLSEGVMHSFKIRKGDIVIAACNPPTEDYQVNEMVHTEIAMASRFLHVCLEPSASEWIMWAKASGIHQSIISVVEQSNHALGDMSIGDEYRVSIVPDGRKMTRLGKFINALESVGEVDKEVLLKIGSAMIGFSLAKEQIRFMSDTKVLTYEDILNGKVLTKKFDIGTKVEVCTSLNDSIISAIISGKLNFDPTKTTDKNYSKFYDYFTLINRDVFAAFTKGLKESVPSATIASIKTARPTDVVRKFFSTVETAKKAVNLAAGNTDEIEKLASIVAKD